MTVDEQLQEYIVSAAADLDAEVYFLAHSRPSESTDPNRLVAFCDAIPDADFETGQFLQGLADDIVADDAALVVGAIDEDADCRAFNDWILSKGAQSSLRFVKMAPFGLCGVAARDIAPGDVAIRIPSELILTPRTARSEAPFDDPALCDDSAFLLFVARHASDPSSPYALYFRNAVLPPLPLLAAAGMCAEFEFEELRGCALFDATVAELASLRKWFDGAVAPRPQVFDPSIFSFERILTARALIDSRSFVVDIDGTPPPSLLVGVDALNHTPSPAGVKLGFDSLSRTYAVASRANVKKDTQFFISYARGATNARLFASYGFVPARNPCDALRATLDLDPPLLQRCAQFGVSADVFFRAASLAAQAVATFRILAAVWGGG
jgi:hypothetical protein